MHLLFTIPDRFYDFCHMDQKTFFELADWIMANVSSQLSCDVSIEESLFMFFDIVARGNSFTDVAEDWRHDVKLAQRYVCQARQLPCSRAMLTRLSQYIPQCAERAECLS